MHKKPSNNLINKVMLAGLSADFNAAITDVYKYEGGFQKQPQDSGNFYKGKLVGTNLGITPNAYYSFYKVEPTEDIIKGLTKQKTSPIYKKNYWDKIRGDEIKNDSVANLMLDIVVNSGTGMIKSFKVIGNATNGKKIFAETSTPFTAEEIRLLNSLPQDVYFNNIKTARTAFYKRLVEKTPSNSIYLDGWLKRLNKHIYNGVSSGKLTGFNSSKGLLIGLVITGLIVAGGGYYYYKRKKRV